MPNFTFKCSTHGSFSVRLNEAPKEYPCDTCLLPSLRSYKASGGLSVVEIIDNGLMARKVERLHNIEEIVKETADKDAQRLKNIHEPDMTE